MAYGSPDGEDGIESYFTHIRGGRPPSPQALEHLRERYRAIGGSPLSAITREQAEAAAPRLAEAARVPEWEFAFQSASDTGEAWFGPGLLERLGAVKARRILVCPIGFVADHLEILYDLDVEAKGFARSRGIELRRTASFNARP